MNIPWNDIINREGLSRLPDLVVVRPSDAPHQARGKRLLQFFLVLMLAGLVAGATAMIKHGHVMGTTSEISWGVLIATYVYLAVSSTGLCLVSSLGHVFGFKVFEPLARRAVFLAIVSLMMGFAVMATELESPLKMARWIMVSPNPRAPIWWMGTFYGIYVVLIITELFFLFKEDHHKASMAGLGSVFAAIAAYSNLGAVFGSSHSRAFWYGPLLPIYFIVSALVSGAAILILMVTLTDFFTNDRELKPEHAPMVDGLRKLLALFLAVLVLLSVWRLLLGVAGEHAGLYEATMAALTGPLFVSYWLFEVLLGMVVPFVLLLGPWRKSWKSTALAAFLMMVSFFVMRTNFVYQGQMVSLKPVVGQMGERYSYMPPYKGNVEGFLSYTPSLVEVLIVAGAISAAVFFFVVGLRALRLSPKEA
ncbi:MAG: NrfD/PsrC family molybdoenzyme membrane anchor subunit [Myxococcota bacterium]